MKEWSGTYCGGIPSLKGKTALLHHAEGGGHLAQFDEFGLTYNGADLSHKWHWFAPLDFNNLREMGVQENGTT
jgi:hypothetical protein